MIVQSRPFPFETIVQQIQLDFREVGVKVVGYTELRLVAKGFLAAMGGCVSMLVDLQFDSVEFIQIELVVVLVGLVQLVCALHVIQEFMLKHNLLAIVTLKLKGFQFLEQ